ncbi:uncharacterized protein LOC143020860 isoform X2 [Oratosquilla oratoria]|uniref:uncharacterized protein LOC143020860 isoform X2 n=1 Tax=Oratosquilla oratoria TaxID=337810 RepID=UPI003F7624AA
MDSSWCEQRVPRGMPDGPGMVASSCDSLASGILLSPGSLQLWLAYSWWSVELSLTLKKVSERLCLCLRGGLWVSLMLPCVWYFLGCSQGCQVFWCWCWCWCLFVRLGFWRHLVSTSLCTSLCKSRKEITPNHVFHAFPKDTARSMAWLNVIQVPQLFKKSAQDLNRSYRLCSRHFSPKNYTNGTTSSRLLQNALPDQNLNCVATSPPISSSITPTDSNGEVASQASKCSSLKHAIEDDSHAYTDLNHRKQNTSGNYYFFYNI